MTSWKFQPTLAKGDIVLITGVNGYIAAHIADQTLAAGYRVRGTVRSIERAKWAQEFFDKKYGEGKFELVEVGSFDAETSFTSVIKGVSAIAHTAVDVTFTGEPEPYIGNITASTLAVLKAAKEEPSIKSIVLTSSSVATVPWLSDVEYTFGVESFNEKAIKEAYEEPFLPQKAFTVYAAAKAISEKAAWKWVEEEKPGFVFNTVLPSANFGKSVTGEFQSTFAWAKMVLDGDFGLPSMVPPQHYINVVDNAKLHLGALVHPEVKNERVMGFAEPYNWNDVLAIAREVNPGKTFPADIEGLGHDLGHPKDRPRSEWLLRELGQENGFTTFRETLTKDFANL